MAYETYIRKAPDELIREGRFAGVTDKLFLFIIRNRLKIGSVEPPSDIVKNSACEQGRLL